MSEILTIKENKSYQRAYNRGSAFVSPTLVTYVIKNKSNNLRVGITTSKKIGKAVQRNRCRRIIKAAFRSLKDDIKPGYDIVFVARTKTAFVKSTDISRCMTKHLKDANIFIS